MTYGHGTFLVTGQRGTILTSADGLQWTGRNSDTTNWLRKAIYHRDKFVVIGNHGTILTSVDGIVWNPVQSPTTNDLRGITQLSNVLVATGESSTILVSADAISWTLIDTGSVLPYANPPLVQSLTAIAASEDRLVVVGGTILVANLAPLRFDNVKLLDGSFQFSIGSYSNRWYQIEAATDLQSEEWTVVGRSTRTTLFVEPKRLDFPQRFYRAREIPP